MDSRMKLSTRVCKLYRDFPRDNLVNMYTKQLLLSPCIQHCCHKEKVNKVQWEQEVDLGELEIKHFLFDNVE